jgi:endonuclease YncB( thermonuclease family)
VRKAVAGFAVAISTIFGLNYLNDYTRGKRTLDDLGPVKYIENPDGDTIVVDISNLPALFGKHIAVRVAHVDTAEMGAVGKGERRMAQEAAVATAQLLGDAKKIELVSPKRDKYFRILADVRIDSTTLLSEYLLSHKLAVPYEGDAKPQTDWCTIQPVK